MQFEYYNKINQLKKSQVYFNVLEKNSQKWLLQSNNCLAFKFLLSKIDILSLSERKNDIIDDTEEMYIDPNDLYTIVIYKFYKGISYYFQGKTKMSISILNDLLNEVSFKNYFYIETEIKLLLAYLYIQQKEFDIAENLLKSLTRKLTGLKTDSFKNVKEAVKIFTLLMNGVENASTKSKIKKTIEQFNFYNFNEKKILNYLKPEFDRLAS
ncbi:MAG: hypothetical protein Q8M29_03570 [Bacteroidota bacterium]|nr:hypothetical protein [Bacteroidota bacterium]